MPIIDERLGNTVYGEGAERRIRGEWQLLRRESGSKGHARLIIQSDGEPAVLAFVASV